MNIEDIKKFIINSKKFDKLANSYIIYGGEKKERIEIATFLASSLNCENLCCGNCDSCLKIKNRTHPDVKWIIPEKSLLSIDEVRWIKEDIFISPYLGKSKSYIFQINFIKEEAANSFLKILEEPPSYSNIIILSDNINFFLPTIISRCHKLKLNYCLPEFNEEMEKSGNKFNEIFSTLEEKKYFDFFKLIDTFVKDKEREEIESFLENISVILRDIYFKKNGLSSNLLVNKNICDKKVVEKIDIEKIEKTIETKNRIRYNVNIKLALENLFFSFFTNSSL